MEDDIEILEIEEGQTVPLLGKYKIFLYTDRPSPALRIDDIKEFLTNNLSPRFEVEVVGDFFNNYMPEKIDDREKIISSLADAKRWVGKMTFSGFKDLTHDEKIVSEKKAVDFNVPYDSISAREIGYGGYDYVIKDLAGTLYGMIPDNKKDDDAINIIFTSRGLGDTDINGGSRPHARNGYYGRLKIISTTGIIEGPEVPAEYRSSLKSGVYLKEHLIEKFKDKMLFENDNRIKDVAKGLSLQAVLSHFTYDPFCNDNECRLYDAHLQKELITSQVNGHICKKHVDILNYLRDPSKVDRDALNALFK